MNKGIRKVFIGGLSILLTIAILIGYYKYAVRNVEDNYSYKVGHAYAHEGRDGGMILLEKAMRNKDILLLGSSDLRIKVDGNPVNVFPNKTSNKNIVISGKPRVQSLLNAIKLGALDANKDSNVAVIVSLQWFMRQKVEKASFNSNFSELQYYSFLDNNHISEPIKEKIADRVYDLTYNYANNNATVFTALRDKDDLLSKIVKPFFGFQQKFLQYKDVFQSNNLINKVSRKNRKPTDKSWNMLRDEAEKKGEKSVTNNNMYVDDKYYNNEIKPALKELEGKYKNVDLLKSDEFNDYELFLELCKDLGIKPYIIVESTNGYFYDYAGIPKDKRNEYYNKIRELTEKYGFEHLDLKDYEYEKYFYFDAMHLGWKGWLHVSEEMAKYFK